MQQQKKSSHGIRRKPKPHHHEEHDNAERYLITYADLITLLLGLFVILYASSQVDAAKYNGVVSAFTEYFEEKQPDDPNSDKVLPGSQGIPAPILPASQEKTLDELDKDIKKSFEKFISNGTLTLERTPKGLALRLPEMLLFRSGSADLQPVGLILLDTLASLFQGVRKQFIIEGHTDSMPIKRNYMYPSNLHLSSARALNVGYYLIQRGIDKSLCSAQAYGESQPLVPNNTEQGRQKNRRVEIILEDLPIDKPSDDGYITDSLNR
ncbi:MAG: flagellar motor protein MotB [Candidatus Kapaibacterium sp.]|jgi:chemotaxis protein MotB|nr:OmpA family protein [Candidatus Kapabacteria bacterium]